MAEGPDHAAVFRERYVGGDAPWDTGRPNSELLRILDAGKLPGPRVLEMGCGTGTNAVELARRGLRVTAVDLVDLAVERGRQKAREAGVEVDFRVGDLLNLPLGPPYDSVFDLGLYHGQRTRDLPGLLRLLDRVTRPGTRWFSVAGNAREVSERGPPVVTEEEFRRELGSRFDFLEVREFRQEITEGRTVLMWAILMERRAK